MYNERLSEGNGMSVGLLLKARINPGFLRKLTGNKKTAAQVLREMEKWVMAYCADLRPISFIGTCDDKPTLYLRLHPAAEDIEITLLDSDTFTASANTSTVGPGYHIFVCDMLHRLGERFDAVWEKSTEDDSDETSYFETGDRQGVFDEMTAWLKGIANMFFDGTLGDADNSVRLALPLDVGFESDERATTPMGPRDVEWLKKTAEDGTNGRDFFAWWTPS